jgi:hypothetical protein
LAEIQSASLQTGPNSLQSPTEFGSISIDVASTLTEFDPISTDVASISIEFSPISTEFDRISIEFGPISVDESQFWKETPGDRRPG